mmetsp:Transcript_7245/g.13522  ORF Transcript_7245/g.13522 Transcript_7245/m.13522 type:complete len:83 (+) Transcript_7245:1209-1457(+)
MPSRPCNDLNETTSSSTNSVEIFTTSTTPSSAAAVWAGHRGDETTPPEAAAAFPFLPFLVGEVVATEEEALQLSLGVCVWER